MLNVHKKCTQPNKTNNAINESAKDLKKDSHMKKIHEIDLKLVRELNQ